MVILNVNISNKSKSNLAMNKYNYWFWSTGIYSRYAIYSRYSRFNVQISTNAIHYTNRLKEKNTWSTNEEIDLMI